MSVVGGVMDDDRVTSIQGDQLTVTDHGKIRASRRLGRGTVERVERLANEVAEVTMPEHVHEDAVDGGTMTIEIAADKTKRIELCAGEDAPEPVWALLNVVEALGRDAGAQQRG